MFRVALAALISLPFLSLSATASEINISGSTSVARVMDVLAEQYNQVHPKTYIAVQGIGSTAGVTLVKKGVAELGMSSRYLTESEQDETLSVHTIAMDGLAVIVNQANPVKNITREQLYDVYKGNITNWKQLGGDDQKIAVVTREASSGSQYSFESLLGLTKTVNGRMVSDVNPDNLVVNSNSMVKTLVNHNSQAIGFVSLGSVDRSVKAINFEGVEATNKNVIDNRYELARPFLIFYQTNKLDQESQSFVDYLQSKEAKQLINEYGYTASK
ncbi:phosphate ABC transporter substrate-binding protein [Vibrio panuliri]|uniref:Phosphate ABC transporter substrate-binding protein n=1 Tax=Vibrio panuliri TaxID=1381081 RepID=A0A1Q9HHP4_9VIBR|nr:phosphate ABC transporter substrate-binding protein [Vibrio panuliri]KAB1457695.1 phosphate ABC transporter substrate-binding protein [Vibrio panuliri]OLQ89647.1 phosphate ABC transporter substrate-binding protein [Vibrio panuliri]OLQ96405.1 phosphate ABC transporter substrate-binding protein [Vibrio panuliri]